MANSWCPAALSMTLSPTLSMISLGALAYFLGSIPFGFIIATLRNIDLRAAGSGNIGATNVFRTVGKSWGILTLFLDALKGYIAAALLPRMLDTSPAEAVHLGLLFGVLGIAGHTWPIFLRFKGGKGVATSAGVLLALAPATMGAGLVAFALLFAMTRYVSAASMGASLVVAVSGWVLHRQDGFLLPMTLTCLAVLIVWRHRANIQRLVRGEENRLELRKR